MASARVMVACPEGQYTKVATSVNKALISVKKTDAYYSHNFALTGDAAPTTLTEALPFSVAVDYDNSALIDIYVWCTSKVGIVGVD